MLKIRLPTQFSQKAFHFKGYNGHLNLILNLIYFNPHKIQMIHLVKKNIPVHLT